MNVFDYQDYKKLVNEWISAQPRGGHGQLRQLAEFLNVNSVVMSQVFRGTRDLSAEQAVSVAKFLGLNDRERDFFILLVQRARAGTKELEEILFQQIESSRVQAQTLKNRIRHSRMEEADRATFYSQWYYSAIRLGTSIKGLNTIAELSDHLQLERNLVSKVIHFLLNHKLVIEKDGTLDMGPQVTHVAHDSPFVNRHHSNWRLKALQSMDRTNEDHLFYTGPMALSKAAAKSIRKDLVQLIEINTKNAANSKSEILACLNIDWFLM